MTAAAATLSARSKPRPQAALLVGPSLKDLRSFPEEVKAAREHAKGENND
jgi:hypothetical protein